MVLRKIIKIDEDLCTGCGECIPNCPEGALQIIDEKARIVSDLFCDGLGACMGHCPEGAITIEEREAEKYDERAVMENVIKQGKNVIKAHLEHLRDHDQNQYLHEAIDLLKEKNLEIPIEEPGSSTYEAPATLPCGCPGSTVKDLRAEHEAKQESQGSAECSGGAGYGSSNRNVSELRQWPVQFMLVPTNAPFLKNADILITGDCVPIACPNYHDDLLKGKILLSGCPKFDNIDYYKEKLVQMLKDHDIRSVTVAIMEVPCCVGLYKLVVDAIEESNVDVPLKKYIIDIKGEILEDST